MILFKYITCTCRYVDPHEYLIRKDFVDFLEYDKITGEALATKILRCLSSYGLDLTKLQGQGYDGAGNMSGRTKSTSTLISKQYPLALYLHCASHCLNLVVVKSLLNTSKYIIIIFSV